MRLVYHLYDGRVRVAVMPLHDMRGPVRERRVSRRRRLSRVLCAVSLLDGVQLYVRTAPDSDE